MPTTRSRTKGKVIQSIPESSVRSTWWIALALVAVGSGIYANSLSAPFVFDDHGSIVENQYLRHLWPLSSALGAPMQSAAAGRPVVSLSLALNYALAGGLTPSAFRVWNLCIHLTVALLLFGVVRRTLVSPTLSARFSRYSLHLAGAVALIWLVHPLNSEVVDYVTQRTESTLGLCYLATLYLAIRAVSATASNSALAIWLPSVRTKRLWGSLPQVRCCTTHAPLSRPRYRMVARCASRSITRSAQRRISRGSAGSDRRSTASTLATSSAIANGFVR